jgi:2-amino-4-hydroxy-6-hydroxymethyldihydropteridine diphosphokinase
MGGTLSVGIGLGSNQGDRLEHLKAAVAWLKTISSGVKCSSVYQTAPIDCDPGSPSFLNAVCEIQLEKGCDLVGLLHQMREFERQRGRPVSYSKNSSRPLDMDILYAGEMVLNTPDLTVPHPRLCQREFVLKPLADLHPDLVLPSFSKMIKDLLLELGDSQQVKLFEKNLG